MEFKDEVISKAVTAYLRRLRKYEDERAQPLAPGVQELLNEMYRMLSLANSYQAGIGEMLNPEVRRLIQQGVDDLKKEEVHPKRHLLKALAVGMIQTFEAGKCSVGETLPARQGPQTIAESLDHLEALEKKIGEKLAPAVQDFLNIVPKEEMEVSGGRRGSVLRTELQILVEAMEQAFEEGRKLKEVE